MRNSNIKYAGYIFQDSSVVNNRNPNKTDLSKNKTKKSFLTQKKELALGYD